MTDPGSLDALRARAVKLLARREHTAGELARKLAPHGTEDGIAAVIAELQAKKLQSDARYAEAYLRTHASRFGAARLRQTLKSKGVDGETIAIQLAAGERPDELAQARAAWQRKFGTPPADRRDWARQARFLQGKGYATATIRRLLDDPEGEP